MWKFARPSPTQLEDHLAAQRSLPLTYSQRAWTRDQPTGDGASRAAPPGFVLDRHRQYLGRGEDVFLAARESLRAWEMFPERWTAIHPHAAGIAPEQVVGVLVRALGVWWLNSARIVYVIDEPRRFVFAYGTLPGHAECGEERFAIEWQVDDTVWYELIAFSRPRYWMARLGKPLTRLLQRRFARESRAAMAATVNARLRGNSVSA
jgi:uncharacterized protein (UPF0548 family)